MATEAEATHAPATSVTVVLAVIMAEALFALGGLGGTIYLCQTSANPTLVAAAVKMIQTDPSSAMAALMLLRTDAAIIAIVSGLTGVAIGSLGGVLNSSRTQYPSGANGKTGIPVVASTTKTETTTTAETTTVPPVPAEPLPVTIENTPERPVPVKEGKP